MLKKLIALPLALILLAAVSCGAGDPAPAEKAPVKAAPTKVTLMSTLPSDAFIGKVTYVDLWGVWCPPCMRSMPHLQETWMHYKDNPDFQLMAVNTGWRGDSPKKVADWVVKNTKYSFPVYLEDRAKDLQIATLQKVQSIPRVIIYDKTGAVVYNDHPMKVPAGMIDELLAK
jgi:thiol-disulfide isomerase/thioredoxin